MYEEKNLQCTDCGADFPFSAEEQEFYAEKGFSEPKRCKPCRQARKEQRRGGGGGGYRSGNGGGGRGGYDRQLHDAVCSSCGIDTMVPFEPDGSRPIYCRDCYAQQRASSGAY